MNRGGSLNRQATAGTNRYNSRAGDESNEMSIQSIK
jgi:hypothetical protein